MQVYMAIAFLFIERERKMGATGRGKGRRREGRMSPPLNLLLSSNMIGKNEHTSCFSIQKIRENPARREEG